MFTILKGRAACIGLRAINEIYKKNFIFELFFFTGMNMKARDLPFLA
jgi:hypothetical protein